ncbi:baculoviral IAP repeat-containing protein 7-B-like [Cloeon dipterum]|uniref:baculoviral IAP repeat-containing protein 7-B-like n=1 Tax=Cloeon dipterum TaxID=197152 RepID=UPI00321FD88C
MEPTGSNFEMFCNQPLNFKFEAHRLSSLLKKIDWKHVEPFGLAKSGFYYTGVDDKVRCTFCNLEVRGWEEGDTPDGEHTRWNPNCPFMRNRQSVPNIEIGNERFETMNPFANCERFQGNVSMKVANVPMNMAVPNNPFRRNKVALPSIGASLCVDNKMKFGKQFHIIGDDIYCQAEDFNIKEWSPPMHPQFVTLKARNDSFICFWPRCLKQTPFEMAKVGFFHTGYGDSVICFHCNLGLKHWDPNDDPFVEHFRWNSKCQFLLMSKGQPYIDQMLHLIQITDLVMASTGKGGWHIAPLYPEFAIYTSRYNSFDFLPNIDTKTAIALSRAGFFYTGIGNQVVCFHCNLVMKEWDPNDDPYVKHCRLNADCRHLMLCNGKSSYVKHVLQCIQNQEGSGSREGDLRCLKCNLNIVSKVNLPCGHMTFCYNCSEPLCEKCSKDIIACINDVTGFTGSDTMIHSNH